MENSISLPTTFEGRTTLGYKQEVTIDIERRGSRWRVAKIFNRNDPNDLNFGARQRFFASLPLTKTEAIKAAIRLAEVLTLSAPEDRKFA